jgi:hypothetical protein
VVSIALLSKTLVMHLDAPSWICGTLISTIQNVKIYLNNPNVVFLGPDF